MDDNMKMSTKEKFELLYKSLVETSKRFVENTMKTTAFLIIVLGWLLTSAQTRAYLGCNRTINRISLVVVVVISVIHILTCIFFYNRSKKESPLLSKLNYVEPDYYSYHRISLPHLLIVLIMNTFLFFLIFMLVLSG